jgi:hypothetical protein
MEERVMRRVESSKLKVERVGEEGLERCASEGGPYTGGRNPRGHMQHRLVGWKVGWVMDGILGGVD